MNSGIESESQSTHAQHGPGTPFPSFTFREAVVERGGGVSMFRISLVFSPPSERGEKAVTFACFKDFHTGRIKAHLCFLLNPGQQSAEPPRSVKTGIVTAEGTREGGREAWRDGAGEGIPGAASMASFGKMQHNAATRAGRTVGATIHFTQATCQAANKGPAPSSRPETYRPK